MSSYIRPSGGTFTTLGPEVDEQIRQGTTTTYTYEGTYDEMLSQRQVERAAGASRILLRPTGSGLWQLQSSFPFGENGEPATDDPQDLHEIDVQVNQPAIWNSELLRSYLGANANLYIATTKTFAEDFQAGKFLDAGGHPDVSEATSQLSTKLTSLGGNNVVSTCQNLFKRFTSGTDSFLEYTEVYRRTITAASYTQVRASYVGVGQIWKTSEVEAYEGIPNGQWFGLRSGMYWLKAPPSVQAATGGKTQIQYYYTEVKNASGLVYSAYGSATLLDI